MPGDVEVQNASTIMADDKEAVEHPERDRWNGKEIHGGDGFPVITKKGKPAIASLTAPTRVQADVAGEFGKRVRASISSSGTTTVGRKNAAPNCPASGLA